MIVIGCGPEPTWADLEAEAWRQMAVPGLGAYAVSTLGRVRGPDDAPPEMRAGSRGAWVSLVDSRTGGRVHMALLVLMIQGWLGYAPEPGWRVVRLDGDLLNCRLSNLAWQGRPPRAERSPAKPRRGRRRKVWEDGYDVR